MGDLPLMTATGTFVINGAERLLSASWYVPLESTMQSLDDKIGKETVSSTVIPNRGAWLEY